MASNNILSDADLKSRLAHFGIVCPISNSTRQVLLKKLQKLEMDSHKPTSQSIENELYENMVNQFKTHKTNYREYTIELPKTYSFALLPHYIST